MDKRYIYAGIFIGMLLVMALITVILLFTLLWNNKSVNGSKLVIDHDGGADDAMAIFIALIHEEYFDGPQVVALTTTFGNVYEPQAFINTQRILNIAQRRNIRIYRGSQTPFIDGIETDYYYGLDGLGDSCEAEYEPILPQPDHAVHALLDLSIKHEGNLIIVAIGAMTNIALAVKMDPLFISRLSKLYVGAGFVEGPDHQDAEFNAAMDPEAYYIVTKNANPNKVMVVPFSQVYSSMNLTRKWRESTLGVIPTKMMEVQNCFERVSMSGNYTGWTQLDPAVMALALNDSLVEEIKYSNNSIILCGDKRSINTNEFTSVSEANVALLYSGNREHYQELLMNTFTAELDQT
ncbi:inosine-uridine preferring nucleoside hydrolase-like [Plodia interpunctella]|uniref:inosine-uridine preferring nucleoside hydrolase-like n=1 Tax=Plodia interpunctella TaxID=58824 RepID=UPI002368061B|nr:inosine-uridine preferring nucleoside hydrolase-like [Plodia interpunctella]